MSVHTPDPLAITAERSDLVRLIRSLRVDGGVSLALSGVSLRPLREDEVHELIANGNTSDGWHRVRVAYEFRPVRIRNSDFRGDVVLGQFDGMVRGPGGAELAAGIYRSTLDNCVVGANARVSNVGLLSGYVLESGACISDCGRVVCDGPTTFGNGATITIGPQTGGRLLRAFAEITLCLADALVSRPAEGEFAARYRHFITSYLDLIRSDRGVIASGATIAHVPVVRNSFFGPAAVVDAATRIDSSTLLSSHDEPILVRDGACVTDSILQWGVRVSGPAVVERSVLLEHSGVDRFGRVTDSLLGPNTTVGGAEITSSLVGPFVGCNHQGMLVAARWPGGRGNLGYGAGVGCNHTSRAPDQEAVLGEGLFVGLGATLQYPIDLSASPYTLLASGVTLPPQRLAFPFSLVRASASPIPGAQPGMNQVIPGWMLSDNLYAIQRSVIKFRARDRSTRHWLAHEVFRPDIMAQVTDALRRLERVHQRAEVYTEREIPGLGRNVLLEQHRAAAVRCYTEHLDRFHLLRLLEQAHAPDSPSASVGREALSGLSQLGELLDKFARAVERSRARDEERGTEIFDDYLDTHVPTSDDPVVRRTWDEVQQTQAQVARVLASLELPSKTARLVSVLGSA